MKPKVIIHNVSNYKISDEENANKSLITFSFDIPVVEYSVNVIGTSPTTGIVGDSGLKNIQTLSNMTIGELMNNTISNTRQFDSNAELTAEIDWTELYQEGNNQVNIYGKSLDGEWTIYMDE